MFFSEFSLDVMVSDLPSCINVNDMDNSSHVLSEMESNESMADLSRGCKHWCLLHTWDNNIT